jgi:hypothetical protein
MKIIKELNITPLFKEQFFWKDCSLKFLKSKFDNELLDDINYLVSHLPNPKKFITIDIGYQLFTKGTKSCRNTGWHVDGVGNDYLMYIAGDFRTEFMVNPDAHLFPEERDKLLEFNNSIQKIEAEGEEIPNKTLIQYTSKDIHKGRVATGDGERFFLRVCSSDYLTPKNFKLY